MLRNIFWKVGVLGDYRLEFWKFALRRLARGEIEYLISSILVAHHLIMFARDASGGQTNASNYSIGCARHPFLPSNEPDETAGAAGRRSLSDLREFTPARVGLGRAGAGLPTKALLEFTLDHARARDAVHAAFDVAAIALGLRDLGLEAFEVASCAADRKEYLRRPDLGRKLDPASQHLLASRKAAVRAGLRSSSAMACRHRRSMRTRSNWCAI